MTKSTNTFGKIVAVFFLLLFVCSLPLALIARDIKNVAFNPPIVNKIIGDEIIKPDFLFLVLEGQLRRQIAESASNQESNLPDIAAVISMLDQEDLKQIKAEILPDEIILQWVAESVDGVYKWLEIDGVIPPLVYDLRGFKARINSEHGINAFLIVYDNLEPCTEAQIAELMAQFIRSPDDVNFFEYLCKIQIPGVEEELVNYLSLTLPVIANQLPDQLNLSNQLEKNLDSAQMEQLVSAKKWLNILRMIMSYLWIVPLGLILMVAAITVRSFKSLGQWVGIPVVIGGSLSLLPFLLYRGLFSRLLANSQLSLAPDVIFTEINRIILRFTEYIFSPLIYQALIIIAVGILMLVLMIVIPDKKSA
jgi:hypothetical protein